MGRGGLPDGEDTLPRVTDAIAALCRGIADAVAAGDSDEARALLERTIRARTESQPDV